MDVEQQNNALTSRDGKSSRANRMKGITKRRIDPCPGCSVPGCTLRVGCLLIGVIEIVSSNDMSPTSAELLVPFLLPLLNLKLETTVYK